MRRGQRVNHSSIVVFPSLTHANICFKMPLARLALVAALAFSLLLVSGHMPQPSMTCLNLSFLNLNVVCLAACKHTCLLMLEARVSDELRGQFVC
jgi:hypothetical protein